MGALVSGERILRVRVPHFCRRTPNNRFGVVTGLIIFGWLCTGCIPLKFTTSPGATGRILNASTLSPVIGAEIAISRSTYPPESPEIAFTNSRAPLVMTGENGGFSIPNERRFDLYFAPVDIFPRFGLLVVRCKGYQTTCLPFWSRSVANLGDIQVRPGEAKN